MYALLNRFLRQQNGVAATEFALVTPIFLLMFLSVTELGNMIYYSISIEKGMRSGVTYAARNHVPLSEEVIVNTISLTRTGAFPSAGAPVLVKGYGMEAATVEISTSTFEQKIEGQGEDIAVTIIKLNVDVPYVALIPGITGGIIGETPSIKLTHEQAIIGD
jgi:Flp pilus assembly pilin Flp